MPCPRDGILMFSEPIKGLIMIAAGSLFAWQACASLQRGVVATAYASYPRRARPAGFWLHVALFAAVGGACAIAGVARFLLI